MAFGGGRRRGVGSSANESGPTPDTPVKWSRLFSYLGPYKLRMVVAILALGFYSIVGLAFPLIIVQLLESVLKHKDFGQLNNIAAGLVGLFLFQSAVSFLQGYNLTYIGERIVLDLRTSLYKHLQALSLD